MVRSSPVSSGADARRMLDAYAAGAPAAIAFVFGHRRPRRALLELGQQAGAGRPARGCIDADAARRFGQGRVAFAAEVELVRHALGCPGCRALVDHALADGGAIEARAIENAVRGLRARSFANVHADLDQKWRRLLKFNLAAMLAETLISIMMIVASLFVFARGLPSTWPVLLATAPLTLFLYVCSVVPAVLRWRDGVLVAALPPARYLSTPEQPASGLDCAAVTRSWRRFSRSIALRGMTAYLGWGAATTLFSGRWVMMPLAIALGLVTNVFSWSRLIGIRIEWFYDGAALPADHQRGHLRMLVLAFVTATLAYWRSGAVSLEPIAVVSAVVLDVAAGAALVYLFSRVDLLEAALSVPRR